MRVPLVTWLIRFAIDSNKNRNARRKWGGMSIYLDKTASLTPSVKRIICDKATEYPHTGEYNTLAKKGTYLCRRCGLALFRSESRFHSGCGWPSFDEEIASTVNQLPDADGQRTEILCERCDAHLGHVFSGEHFTHKNLRHCVNSASLDFVADSNVIDTEEAIVAGGCFWGVDYFLRKVPGVLKVEVGYCGGELANPRYEQVNRGDTGHYEATRVVYDVAKTNYSKVLKRFFEIHDPTQHMGQGPDMGYQYQSAIFYYNQEQHEDALTLIQSLRERGYDVATHLLPVQTFWPAESYHQNYYAKHQKAPYCHRPINRFS